MANGYLAHFGIKGQRWGVRRYQNPDGTLTEAGKKRYQKENFNKLKVGDPAFDLSSKNYGRMYAASKKASERMQTCQDLNDKSFRDFCQSETGKNAMKDFFGLDRFSEEQLKDPERYFDVQDWWYDFGSWIPSNPKDAPREFRPLLESFDRNSKSSGYQEAREQLQSAVEDEVNNMLGKYGNRKIEYGRAKDVYAENVRFHGDIYDAYESNPVSYETFVKAIEETVK